MALLEGSEGRLRLGEEPGQRDVRPVAVVTGKTGVVGVLVQQGLDFGGDGGKGAVFMPVRVRRVEM